MNEIQDDGAVEISLLDILVAIAENWLLLVFVPLIAGVVVFGAIWFSTPSQFQSDALLRMSADEAILLRSERVLSIPELNGAQDGESTSAVGATIAEQQPSIEDSPNEDLYRLTARAGTPDDAYQLLTAIIDAVVVNSAPTASRAERLELRRAQVEASLEELEAGLARLNRLADNEMAAGRLSTDIASGELGQALASILDSIGDRRDQLFEIKQLLVGTVAPDDVVQSPSLPKAPMPRGLIAPVMMAVLGTGFLMLIVAFIRTGISNARSKETIEKINRIRRAFWLRPVEGRQ